MKAKCLLLPALLLAIVIPGTLYAGQQPDRAPVLFLQVNNSSGLTVLLQVYNDGTATLGQVDSDHPDGEICTASVPAAVRDLVGSLHRARADRLRSQDPIAGKSAKTVSFFGNDQRGHTVGNTFVYYNTADYQAVGDALNAFIGTSFPNCV